MLNKKYFFNKFNFNKRELKQNIKKTKKCFDKFKLDLKNFEIPLLDSYEKDYNFDFSYSMIKKFNKYENIIIIGMGGSILGTKSIYSFFKNNIKKKVLFFDNLDADLITEYKKIKNIKNSCLIIVSKSGNTLETLSNFFIIFSEKKFKNKLIFITENKDNILMNLAQKYKAEIIEHKEFIGGRYSIMSETSMFPASLMGSNILKFKNLKNLIKNKNFISTLIYNVASIYTLKKRGIKICVIMSYDSKLNDLCFWYQQLLGESLGKKGKGLTPIISFGPKDHHSVLQLYLDGPKDKFFTFFNSSKKTNHKISNNVYLNSIKFLKNKNIKTLVQTQLNATKKVFQLNNIPIREINFIKNNEEELGNIFTFFVLEVILLARLMNVNPFDQLAVEEIKIETKRDLLR